MTSKPNDAVRVTLSPDSKEISEKMNQSAEKENAIAIEEEIDEKKDSGETNPTDEAKSEVDSNSTETDSNSDLESPVSNEKDKDKDKDKEKDKEEADDPETVLKNKDKELNDVQDRLLRLSAEFENFKKRSRREMSEFKKFAAEVLIKDLLPAVDNLDRALEMTSTDENCKAIIEGVTMTRDEIIKVFSKYGVEAIEALEKEFDPAYHQAVGQEESQDCPENTILKEYQKGYTMHGRLLRPSMVIVSK